jgi:hypothetical protein
MSLQYCITDTPASEDTHTIMATLLPSLYDHWSTNIEKLHKITFHYYKDCHRILDPKFNNTVPFSREHVLLRVKTINANLSLIIDQIFISAIVERLANTLKVYPRVSFVTNKNLQQIAILNIISSDLQKNIKISLEKLICLYDVTMKYLNNAIELNESESYLDHNWLKDYKLIEERWKLIFNDHIDITYILKKTEPNIILLQFFKIGTTIRLTREIENSHNMLLNTYTIFNELTKINAVSITDAFDNIKNLPDYHADELFKWISDLVD